MAGALVAVFLATVARPSSALEYDGGGPGSGIGVAGSVATLVTESGGLQSSIGYITPLAESALPATACITVKGGLAVEGAPVILAPCDGSAAQAWRLLETGDIRGLGDKCLNPGPTADDSGGAFGVVLGPCGEDGPLVWDWMPDSTLELPGGLCLSLPYGVGDHPEADGGTALHVDGCDMSARQTWMVHGNLAVVSGEYCMNESLTDVAFTRCVGAPSQHWVHTHTGWMIGNAHDYLSAFSALTNGYGSIGAAPYDPTTAIAPGSQYWFENGSYLANQGVGSGLACMSEVINSGNPSGPAGVWLIPCGQGDLTEVALASPLTVPLIAEQLPSWDAPTAIEMVLEFRAEQPVPPPCGLVSTRLSNALADGGASSSPTSGTLCCGSTALPKGCAEAMSVGDLLDDQGFSFTWSSVPMSPATLAAELSAGHPVPFEVVLEDGRSVVMLVVGFTQLPDTFAWLTINDPGNSQFGLNYDQWSNPELNGQTWTFAGNYFDIQAKSAL